MTPERKNRIEAVLSKRQPDLTILTDQVHKGRNLSAIVRTADAVGIGHIHCVINDDDYYAFRGTAKGSHQWVKVHRHLGISDALQPLQQQSFQVIAADVTDSSCDFREVDYTRPTVLILGAERDGLSVESRTWVDQFVTVPMVGMVESFNVSVAAGIILAEALRQRQCAGLYDHQRIDNAEFQQLFFEWAHPKIAAYCQEKALAYPPLDAEGEIINPSAWYASVKQQQRQNQ